MTLPKSLTTLRYVTDACGQRTDVLIPLATWEALLTSWKRLIEQLEDEEDRAILREWLAKRASGEAETIPLDELEREPIADGLLTGSG
jgi:hypothetical protein